MANILAQVLANPIVSTTGLALGIGLVALWLAAAWWTYGDAAHRTESSFVALAAAAWIVISTPVLLPLSLAIYRYVRPGVSAADQRSERLAVALAESSVGPGCPACSRSIQPGWRRCPTCTTWLAAPCAACGEWSDPSFDICPHCGEEARNEPSVTLVTAGAASGIAGVPAWSAPSAFWVGQQAAPP
ncbi:MAG TPA: zinc ribbon domain-containing protein, partial [Candidatus Dormibacteraeota bacterium]|nr:zinc ribbon domain-containing protein [Candidatus Dormibacteraeota bacterium]